MINSVLNRIAERTGHTPQKSGNGYDSTPPLARPVGDINNLITFSFRDRARANEKFNAKLRGIPRPGGNGYHSYILGVANLGRRAGLSAEESFTLIRTATPAGSRPVLDREIAEAVLKAYSATPCGMSINDRGFQHGGRGRAPIFDAQTFMSDRIKEATGIGEAEIIRASPVNVDLSPVQSAVTLLERLYAPDDVVYIGEHDGRSIKTAETWLADFRAGILIPPHIIPNPLSGQPGLTKTGTLSLRADACVKSFRFAIAEFDHLSREDQLRFWWAVNLPVCALIDSGGKSIHGWIRIDSIVNAVQWTDQVENQLFKDFLVPLGCDSSCRNESRLSRMPGHYRAEKERGQRLLYLAPDGRRVRI